MMAWAFVVAERLGFQREEALSIGGPFSQFNLGTSDPDSPPGLCAARGIASDADLLRCYLPASVYTEMNAITKGVSLGLYASAKQKGIEANRTGSQPYVELMGRR